MPLRTKPKAGDSAPPLLPTLGSVPFLRDAPPKALKAAEKDTRYFSLPGGWKLFDVGEPSDQIYFVLSGSLGAFRMLPGGRMELVGHIRAGEPVGEMSMIAGEAHEHAVFALRDIDLYKIESRPIRGKKFEYIFYLDFAGSANEQAQKYALDHLAEITVFIRVLGSYPVGKLVHPKYKKRS